MRSGVGVGASSGGSNLSLSPILSAAADARPQLHTINLDHENLTGKKTKKGMILHVHRQLMTNEALLWGKCETWAGGAKGDCTEEIKRARGN